MPVSSDHTGDVEIGILLYSGVQPASVHGLTDLFEVANRVWQLTASNDRQRSLRVSHWRAANAGSRPECVYNSAVSGPADPDILVIPPTMVAVAKPDTNASLVNWLLQHHASGSILVALCSGVFLLAETGLLDDRIVSTHWTCAGQLALTFPKVEVDIRRRVIDYGDIATAGGFLSWVDVGLMLVDRHLGALARAETARFMFVDPTKRTEHYFAGFPPPQAHGDLQVLKAQEWIHIRDGREVSVETLASKAGLEKRTFFRRFLSATGMTPIEYCRAVRIARARELLEGGNKPIKQIAVDLGYSDVASFARIFRKRIGDSPAAYRNRFGLNGLTPSYVVS